MKLGDFISNETKKNLFLPDGIKVGTVLRAFVTTTNPPKEKRFIIVGFNNDTISVASVLINSDINLNVNYCQDLVLQHIPIECKDRSYLTKDSHIDCSCIHEMNISELNEKIDINPDIVIGHVAEPDMNNIMSTLINSITIKGKHKKKFGFFNYEFKENEEDKPKLQE